MLTLKINLLQNKVNPHLHKVNSIEFLTVRHDSFFFRKGLTSCIGKFCLNQLVRI